MSLPFRGAAWLRARGLRWSVFFVYCSVAGSYLVWRLASTINLEHPVYSIVFYAAEVVCVASSVMFYLLVVERRDRPSPPIPDSLPTIDVFIATYNEEPALLRTTVTAARDMNIPHRTWICDDGRRAEVEALANELDVGYITRPDNSHFKAGNINNALNRTTGDLVLILDADHVPRSNILLRLIGHFADPRVALVQIPQVYYNLDSYQHVFSPLRAGVWHEASIFHHKMQPGADRLDSAFFVGTGALLRRTALEQIGGFATGSITEDIHTSMRLHAAGWQSVYVDERLGFMQAAETAFAYARQRLRWAQGSMQILRRENPLFKPGLRVPQRLCYLNSLGGYLLAFQHLIFYLAPGIYLWGGPSPIALDNRIAVPVFIGYILTALLIYKLLAAPHARMFFSECFKMLNLPLFILAAATLLRPDGLIFRVTPKGAHGGWPMAMVVPLVPLLLFNVTAVGLGIARLISGDHPHPAAVILVTTFVGFFGITGALALIHTFQRSKTDEVNLLPVRLEAGFVHGIRAMTIPLQLRRLGHDRAYALVDRLPSLTELTPGKLSIPSIGLGHGVRAIFTSAQTMRFGRRKSTVLSFRLTDLTQSERDRIDRYGFEVALPEFFARTERVSAERIVHVDRHRHSAVLEETDGPSYLPIRETLI